jgi:hypothetical protein
MLVLVALLIVAAIEMTVCKKSLVWGSFGAGIGAAAGLVALVAAWFTTGGWTDMVAPVPVALVFAGCLAFAAEIVLRGWIVERARELGAPALVAVLVGAGVEALIMPGGIGAGVFGIGLGLMYVRGGLQAPVCARVAFACGAVLLHALQ